MHERINNYHIYFKVHFNVCTEPAWFIYQFKNSKTFVFQERVSIKSKSIKAEKIFIYLQNRCSSNCSLYSNKGFEKIKIDKDISKVIEPILLGSLQNIGLLWLKKNVYRYKVALSP